LLISILGILNSLKLTNDLAQNWETIIPVSFYYDHLSEQEITEINVEIYRFYHNLGFLGENKDNLTTVPEIHTVKMIFILIYILDVV
jgi:hypothetical protein